MADRTGIFWGWSVNLSNVLGLGVEAGASSMYPQKMRVHCLGAEYRQLSDEWLSRYGLRKCDAQGNGNRNVDDRDVYNSSMHFVQSS